MKTVSIATLLRSAALTAALGVTSIALPAYAGNQPQNTSTSGIGNVEGYGGFAGRVGSSDSHLQQTAEPRDLSTTRAEGYGGFAGRIGSDQGVISEERMAQEKSR